MGPAVGVRLHLRYREQPNAPRGVLSEREGNTTRRSISLLVLPVALAILAVFVPDILLIVFAGILLAVLLHGGGHWIATRLGIADGWGIGLFLLGIVVALAGFAIAIAPAIGEQVEELTRRIPEALTTLRERIEAYSLGPKVLEQLTPESLASSQGGAAAVSAVSSTFGALGNVVVILFIGLYGALDPKVYRHGLTLLLAPSIRARGDEVLRATATTLRMTQ